MINHMNKWDLLPLPPPPPPQKKEAINRKRAEGQAGKLPEVV